MDWHSLLSRERLGKPVHGAEELGRSPFHKDHDRVIFSGAFRRLGRKTQVHPVSSNDHIHTRLTHSLEVSCVGRSLAMRVGEMLRGELPDWCDPGDLGMIVQSACLAHDIGNRRSAIPGRMPFATGSSRPGSAAGWTTWKMTSATTSCISKATPRACGC